MARTLPPSSPEPQAFDVVVIGSGPGGEGAAMTAAKNGKRVAVIERHREIGGGCTHWATIPSKALRHAVRTLVDFKNNPLFSQFAMDADVGFAELVRTAESVIRRQVQMRTGFYDRNDVTMVHGHARFLDPHTVEVLLADGARERVRADAFVLAPGSRPYRPKDVDFHHPRIFDSDTILNLRTTPHSVTVYGAGVVGCEYASILRNLGIKLNLVNTRDKLLSFLDDEITDALAYHLRDQGVIIRHNEEYESVEPLTDGVVLHLKSGKRLKTDALLWANGRTGNTDDLGLDALGLKTDSRGQLKVDESYRTEVAHVYAVGDVVGFPSLASASYDQGRFAAQHLCTGKSDSALVRDIPAGIWTSPEISSIGRNERELTSAKIPYEVGHAMFRHLARAQITGNTVGMLKLLFHRDTLEVLGIHCFGDQAAEIVHIGQAIMSQPAPNNTIKYFMNTTFNYPTMAEAYRVAALNGYNRL